jgi:hypothetical protein
VTGSTLDIPGAELIVAERIRQVVIEGYSPDADLRYTRGELLTAAWCYLTEAMEHGHDDVCASQAPPEWPWSSEEWKPSMDRARNLVKAGALIAAELDRLLCAAGPTDVPSSSLTGHAGDDGTTAGEPS